MLRLLFILTSLCTFGFAGAQEQLVSYDTVAISARNIPASVIDAYRADPAFQYDVIHQEPVSWWIRFWRWFWERINDVLGTDPGQKTTKLLFIGASIVILALAIYVFMGMRNGGLFGKKNIEDPLAYSVMEDDIHAINFDIAIETAVNEGNYRFAVRLLYLQTLKNLTDLGLIAWQLNKTNVTYVNELNGNPHRQEFYNLTRQFEGNWYGDLPIEAMEFNAVRGQFNQFNQSLS